MCVGLVSSSKDEQYLWMHQLSLLCLFGPQQRWHGTMRQRPVKPNATGETLQGTCHSSFDSASHIHWPGSAFVLHYLHVTHWACSECTDTKGNSVFNVRGLKVRCPLRGWMDFRSLLRAGFWSDQLHRQVESSWGEKISTHTHTHSLPGLHKHVTTHAQTYTGITAVNSWGLHHIWWNGCLKC